MLGGEVLDEWQAGLDDMFALVVSEKKKVKKVKKVMVSVLVISFSSFPSHCSAETCGTCTYHNNPGFGR